MKRTQLDENAINAAMQELQGWGIEEGKLSKTFRFKSFGQAMGWMVVVGHYAEKLDHHPEWCNVYNKVSVNLVTHDMGALSTLDVALAAYMDSVA